MKKFDLTRFERNTRTLSGLSFDQELPADYGKAKTAPVSDRVPHFDVLKNNKALFFEAFFGTENERPYVFTDNAGNIIITGYYNTYGNKPSNFKYLFDNGVLTNNNPVAYQSKTMISRHTGSNWQESTYNEWAGKMLRTMELRQNEKVPYPYIYAFNGDIDIITLSSVAKVVAGIVTDIAVQVANSYTGGIAGSLIATAGELVKKYAQTGVVTIGDTLETVKAFGPMLLNSSEIKGLQSSAEKYTGISLANITRYVGYGEALTSISKEKDFSKQLSMANEYFAITDIKTLNQLADYGKKNDVFGVMGIVGATLLEADKVIRAGENYKLMYEAIFHHDKLMDKVQNAGSSLEVPEVQTFLINTLSSIVNFQELESVKEVEDMLTLLPKKREIISAICSNYKFANPSEFASILDLACEDYEILDPNDLSMIVIDAVVEKAKQAKKDGVEFVLPSNIPPKMQPFFQEEIAKRTGIQTFLATNLEWA